MATHLFLRTVGRMAALVAAVIAPLVATTPTLLHAQPSGWARAGTRGDFIVRNFKFRSGEVLPELKLHYTTLGTPRKDAKGIVRNAIMVLHGTGNQFTAEAEAVLRHGAALTLSL